jgi:hypothetical protein
LLKKNWNLQQFCKETHPEAATKKLLQKEIVSHDRQTKMGKKDPTKDRHNKQTLAGEEEEQQQEQENQHE